MKTLGMYGADTHWGFATFKDKVVLDLGADVGSTAHYFLVDGAKQVIAVECDDERFAGLVANIEGDPRVIPIKLMIDSPAHFEELITKYKPDVAKIDCEYCEKHLPRVARAILLSVPEYIIEAHSTLYLDIEALLATMEQAYNWWKIGFSNICPWPAGCRLYYAKRSIDPAKMGKYNG